MATFDRVLILETSAKVGQAALGTGEAVLAEARLEEGRRRASDLTLAVQTLLQVQGWRARDLTAVVVGLGPGSYTGLRVGLASAKALAYASGCDFFGVETFAAIATQVPSSVDQLSVVGDGLQGKVFERLYERRAAHGWEPVGKLRLLDGSVWLAGLEKGTVVSGPAAEAYAARIPLGVECTAAEYREPHPQSLLLAAIRFPWAVTRDMWRAEPFYLRGSSAEEKAAARKAD